MTAHPRWVVDAYAERLPPDELTAALHADNESPEITLVVRPGLASVDELVAAGARPGRHSPYAAAWSGNPANLAAVRDGRAGVQDEGSQLVTLGLARPDAPAGPWLDLCAGPGGKTALLTGLAVASDYGRSSRPSWPRTGRSSSPPAPGPTRRLSDRRSSSPTAPVRPGDPVRSPGSWPMCRAAASALCAGGRSPGGDAPRPRWRSCTRCS